MATTADVSVKDLSTVREEACRLDTRLAEVTIAPIDAPPQDIARARRPEDA